MTRIVLNAQMHAPLDWKNIESEALNADSIEWVLDFGLFDRLPFPLDNTMQLQSLQLAIDHFLDSIYSRFEEKTSGVCLYEGTLLFADQIQGNGFLERQLLARDAAFDYLNHLSSALPDNLNAFIRLKTDGNAQKWEKAILLAFEPLDSLKVVLEPPLFSKSAPGALCIPTQEKLHFEEIKKAVEMMDQKEGDYRIIFEKSIIAEWDGLDRLYVIKESLTPGGMRGLQGFTASGGEIVWV